MKLQKYITLKNNNMKHIEKALLFFVTLILLSSCETIDDILGTGSESESEKVNLQSALMAYYKFDDNTANDATYNSLNGTLMNKPSFVTETTNGQGKAIFFNSLKDQYMNIPYNPFKTITNYTITMWVKDFGYGSFIRIGGDEDNKPNFDFYYDEEGLFKFRLNPYNSGMGTFTYDAKSLIDGNWHMLTFSRTEALCELYVDGTLVANKELTYHNTPEDPSILIQNHMYFDNLRLYNRVINAKEVKAIYDLEK